MVDRVCFGRAEKLPRQFVFTTTRAAILLRCAQRSLSVTGDMEIRKQRSSHPKGRIA